MPSHSEIKRLPYSQKEMFDLVQNIEDYPNFLPWCVACRIKNREANQVVAELAIGFKMFRERFTSRVLLNPPHEIMVHYEDGPLKYLTNRWRFSSHPDGCELDFVVDFEFRSRVLELAIGTVFGEAVKRMVAAFEQRAGEVYGKARQQTNRNKKTH